MKMLCCLKWEFENGLGLSGPTTSPPEIPRPRSKLIKYFEEMRKGENLSEYGPKKFLYTLHWRDLVISLSLFNAVASCLSPPRTFCERGWNCKKEPSSNSVQVLLLNFSCTLIIHRAPIMWRYILDVGLPLYTLHWRIVSFSPFDQNIHSPIPGGRSRQRGLIWRKCPCLRVCWNDDDNNDDDVDWWQQWWYGDEWWCAIYRKCPCLRVCWNTVSSDWLIVTISILALQMIFGQLPARKGNSTRSKQ